LDPRDDQGTAGYSGFLEAGELGEGVDDLAASFVAVDHPDALTIGAGNAGCRAVPAP
jgi:hypothetical protein